MHKKKDVPLLYSVNTKGEVLKKGQLWSTGSRSTVLAHVVAELNHSQEVLNKLSQYKPLGARIERQRKHIITWKDLSRQLRARRERDDNVIRVAMLRLKKQDLDIQTLISQVQGLRLVVALQEKAKLNAVHES